MSEEEGEYGKASRRISMEVLKPIKAYQQRIGEAANKNHTLVILGALAFVVGVIIGRLPRNDYKEARDYFFNKVDEVRKELTGS